MSNDFSKQTSETLATLSAAAFVVLQEAEEEFGVSAAQVSTLHVGATGMTAAINNQTAAKLAEKAATQAKGQAKTNVVAALNSVAATVYANPAVTDQMLASIGFAPRRASVPRPAVAQGVTGLSAVPDAIGTVALAWDRSGNAKGTVFRIESSADGVSWAIVDTTTRTKATLRGYAPGAAAWFRVTAANSTGAAVPSYPVAVYAPSAPVVQLRVA